jgi:NADPH:quinone reductase-like Zn-dependent oxidoreductase
MKAVVARRGSDVPEVAEVPRQELGANQVRVAVSAAGFTYFDAFVPGHLDALGLPEQVGWASTSAAPWSRQAGL